MYKHHLYSGSDLVSKSIRMEYLFDRDEEIIPGSDDVTLGNAIYDVFPYIIRTPYVAPFRDYSINSKDCSRLTKYQAALIVCIDEVSRVCDLNEQANEYKPYGVNQYVDCIIETICFYFSKENKIGRDAIYYPLKWIGVNDFILLGKDDRLKAINALNSLARIIRKRILSAGMRERVHGFKRNSTECYKNLMNVCYKAWGNHGKILLIRLDWGFKLKYPDIRGKFSSQEDYEVRFRAVSEIREKMLKSLRKMFGDDLVFYAWKIECAPVKGLHIHWMIGLNGDKHQDRINVPRAIVAHWDEMLGNEHAYTWNLSSMQKHEEAILRVIDYSDPLLWRIVGGYVDYLTKVDYFVKLQTPGKMHSFGCTNLKVIAEKKRGPQRSKEMPELDIWAVRGPQGDKSKKGMWI